MADDERVGASLQQTLLRLTRFWTEERCLLLPSCDFEVDAATLHPETFFGLLGADPWRAAYLQPVRRPLDGRRRGHPFRLAKHLQFQVVLKPPPADLRRLYLRSLEEAGCELRVHDLRFADWSWRAPALHGRGAGWHALVDGLGVTRLTYVVRLAGRDLEPAGVELSYGLERLSMVLAGAPTAGDLRWTLEGPAYSELRHADESEYARYVFEVADVAAARQRLEALEREARCCLDRLLARPAYEHAVKALQEIDVLAARGELTAQERYGWIARVGELVAAAAAVFLAAGDAAAEETQSVASAAPAAPAKSRTGGRKKKAAGKKRPVKAGGKRPKRARAQKPAATENAGETADGG